MNKMILSYIQATLILKGACRKQVELPIYFWWMRIRVPEIWSRTINFRSGKKLSRPGHFVKMLKSTRLYGKMAKEWFLMPLQQRCWMLHERLLGLLRNNWLSQGNYQLQVCKTHSRKPPLLCKFANWRFQLGHYSEENSQVLCKHVN